MIAEIFRLTILLEGTDPPIWRRVDVARQRISVDRLASIIFLK